MGEVYCRHLALDKPIFRSKILCSLFISMQGQDVSLPILQSPYDQDRGRVHTHGCSGYDHSNWWVTQHLCRSVLLWVHLESLWVAGEIILQTSRKICEPCIKASSHILGCMYFTRGLCSRINSGGKKFWNQYLLSDRNDNDMCTKSESGDLIAHLE